MLPAYKSQGMCPFKIHLQENLLKAKVIYVARNPKDAMIRKLSNSIKNISEKLLCIFRQRSRVSFLIEKSEYLEWNVY